MKKQDKNPYLIPQIMGVLLFALLIAYPVTLMMRKADNPSDFIPEASLKSLVNEKAEVAEFKRVLDPQLLSSAGGGVKQSEKYTNLGEAILTVNILNITKLTADDFKKIGQTPWSLMNTVKANLKTPQVFDIVFSNKNVVAAFMARQSVQDLGGDYNKIVKMVKSNDYAIERFLKNNVVETVLADAALLDIIMNSKLIESLLQTPSAQYFISNPGQAVQLIEGNANLKPLLQNANLKKALLENPKTALAAKRIFK